MTDNQEHGRRNAATSNLGTSTNTIRYSKETLLSLHDSPLVGKPETMPPLSLWFGEEAGTPAAIKNALNGSIASRSDKSIILGPSKTNFASSLNGGLKHKADGSKSARSRQLDDSMRAHNSRNDNNNNTRMSRGTTQLNEMGSHHHHYHSKNGLERRSSNPTGNQSTPNKRYHNPDHQYNDRKTMTSLSGGGRRDQNHDQRSGNRQYQSNHNNITDRGHDRVPEWLDYDPDVKETSTDDNQKKTYANDLEAWKESMKKKEGLDDTTMKQQPPISQESLPGENGSQAIEKVLDLGSLDLQFISTPVDSIAPSLSCPPSDSPTQRGSRFAKFFAKREEATQPLSPAIPSSSLPNTSNSTNDSLQPKSISVNDLFQMSGNGNSGKHSDSPDRQHSTAPIELNTNKYHGMMSEVDVIKHLGARNPEQTANDSSSMGFNKVLEILSQPKPTVPSSSSDASGKLSPKVGKVQGQDKRLEHDGSTVTSISDTQQPLDPSRTETRSPSILHNQETSTPPGTAATTKPKKTNHLFAGTLPTSVLRQMSARSEGKLPSLNNKPGLSGGFPTTTSQNGSPSTMHMPPSHHPYQYQQAPSPSYHTYSPRATNTQRFDGMHDSPGRSMNNDMIHATTPRNLTNAYDGPYGHPPNQMPPFIPMDRSFAPPPIVPHPMLSPHLPMHPQGPFMPPLGIPQQMYNMNQGWNRH